MKKRGAGDYEDMRQVVLRTLKGIEAAAAAGIVAGKAEKILEVAKAGTHCPGSPSCHG